MARDVAGHYGGAVGVRHGGVDVHDGAEQEADLVQGEGGEQLGIDNRYIVQLEEESTYPHLAMNLLGHSGLVWAWAGVGPL